MPLQKSNTETPKYAIPAVVFSFKFGAELENDRSKTSSVSLYVPDHRS
jgi:hypothetical protein